MDIKVGTYGYKSWDVWIQKLGCMDIKVGIYGYKEVGMYGYKGWDVWIQKKEYRCTPTLLTLNLIL